MNDAERELADSLVALKLVEEPERAMAVVRYLLKRQWSIYKALAAGDANASGHDGPDLLLFPLWKWYVAAGADATRTPKEETAMLAVGVILSRLGVELGLPPVPRAVAREGGEP